MNDTGIHIFLFCCAEYVQYLDECLVSIRTYVIDPILSINIVTNTKIKKDGCNTIEDKNFWSLIDPKFQYRKLYNHNWNKQQIFKLHVDKYVDGNALIIDGDVVFTGPTKFMHQNTVNIYVSSFEGPEKKFLNNNFNKFILDLNFEYDKDKSFVSEVMIFSTEILKNLRNAIENKHKKSWIDIMADNLLVDDAQNPAYRLSEYELYGNYFYKNHKNLINNIVYKSPENFISRIFDIKSDGPLTKWLTFYEQIRDTSWPDCEYEKDFVNLPDRIKKECIEVFGYNPEQHI